MNRDWVHRDCVPISHHWGAVVGRSAPPPGLRTSKQINRLNTSDSWTSDPPPHYYTHAHIHLILNSMDPHIPFVTHHHVNRPTTLPPPPSPPPPISRGASIKVGGPSGAVSLEGSPGGRDKKNLTDEQKCVFSPFFSALHPIPHSQTAC